MNDYQLLTIILMLINIIVMILLDYINHTRK